MNRSLVANFGPKLSYWPSQPHTLVIAWLTNFNNCVLQQNSDLRTANWTTVSNAVSVVGSNREVSIPMTNSVRFYRLMQP